MFTYISYFIYTHSSFSRFLTRLSFEMSSPLIVDSLTVLLQASGHIKSKVCDVKDFVRMSANGIVEPEEVLYVSCSPSHLLSALGTDAQVQTVPGDL